jgi:hypothetical protein
VTVVIISLLLGSAAIFMPSKNKGARDVETNSKGKVKYVSNKRKGSREKKA